MNQQQSLEELQHFEIPGRVMLSEDQDGLIKVIIQAEESTAEIYLKGAHVTSFQQKGEEPLLFMSPSAKIARGTMLHGGIPLCFPWFGNHEGETLSHGFARTSFWNLVESMITPAGKVTVSFYLLPDVMSSCGWAPVEVLYTVTVGKELKLTLKVLNTTKDPFVYEECLHSYFMVGDISKVTVHGLQGMTYLDKNEDLASKLESSSELPIVGETNSIYLNSTETLEIHDRTLQRTVRIEKENSYSTVVWNPWAEKAKTIVDFGPDDYQKMLCVESGNIRERAIKLAPGEASSLCVTLSATK